MAGKNIQVRAAKHCPAWDLPVEMVERKGIGHPDSLADGVAESVSRALSRHYMALAGEILHHNTDKVEIAGGASAPAFGGGSVLRPMLVFISGRATDKHGSEKIDVPGIATRAAREYLAETLPNLDVPKHVEIQPRIGRGSSELTELFKRGSTRLSNDTSIGAGFYPLSDTEKLTLMAEKILNSREFKQECPGIGQDIKVMALRRKDKISLTIAAAAVSKNTGSLEEYKASLSLIKEEVQDLSRTLTGKKVDITINSADNYTTGSIYLTVTGTSAEMGDDGSVGRGNRANGLITPYRPMSIEAASGKNPVTHTGKIYNILASRIAQDIVNSLPVRSASVFLLSQIGKPVDQPQEADIELCSRSKPTKATELKARKIAGDWLARTPEIAEKALRGQLETF